MTIPIGHDLSYSDVVSSWASRCTVYTTHPLHRATEVKKLDSVVLGIEQQARAQLHREAQKDGHVVIAMTKPLWLQHVEDALGWALDAFETGGDSRASRPWKPGTPLADGFVHLTIALKGIAIPLIPLEW